MGVQSLLVSKSSMEVFDIIQEAMKKVGGVLYLIHYFLFVEACSAFYFYLPLHRTPRWCL